MSRAIIMLRFKRIPSMSKHENFWKPRNEVVKESRQEIDAFFRGEHIIDEVPTESGAVEAMDDLPVGLIPTDQICIENQQTSLAEVYAWYSTAMKRRSREPLSAGRFIAHFEGMSSDPTFAFGDGRVGYILGFVQNSIFIPTHFAPRTLRGGYELLTRLGESADIPVVMAITDDLASTIEKMPSWKKLDIDLHLPFRSELVAKKVVYNSNPRVPELMLGIVSEYIAASENLRTEQQAEAA
jgi:hypothetical protein